MANPDISNKPTPVKSEIIRLEDQNVAPSVQAQSPLAQSQYVQNYDSWLAQQVANQPVIRGDARIYSGVLTDYLGGVSGRIQQPFFENADRASLMTWQSISQNPAALANLADIYKAHYRKPADYIPSPNQLMGLLDRAISDASTAAANDALVTVSDVLNSYAAMDVYGIPVGDGPGGGVSSPTQFETRRNEDDVRVLANALAQEMIGRNIDDKEFSKMMRRVRKAEADSPRTISVQGSRQITEEGVSDAERQDVLREVLMENPEFATFQGGEGLIDNLDESARQLQSEMGGL